MTLSTMDQEQDGSSSDSVYYFGYGPIVNPMVRRRRRLTTSDEKPALLPDCRLTFAYGGIVNMIHQRGYEVHGVLMKFSRAEWEQFQAYDVGYNESDIVHVLPYGADDENATIRAYAMTMKEYDQSKLEAPIEQLPTERYLKLLANGMRAYQVDDDYIEDQILSVPYVPSRMPEEYETFPQKSSRLPKITWTNYQKLCQKSKKGTIYFILNGIVLKLANFDPQNPGAMWIKERMHGNIDSTLVVHQTIVEPDLPIVDTLEDLSPSHHAWAENHCVEYCRKCNLYAEKVYELVSDECSGSRNRFKALFRGGLLKRKSDKTEVQVDGDDSLQSSERRISEPTLYQGRRRSSLLYNRRGTTLSAEMIQRDLEQMVMEDTGDTDETSQE